MGKRLQRQRTMTRDRDRYPMPEREMSWDLTGARICPACKIFVLPCQCCIPAEAATFCPMCDGPVVPV